MLTSWFIIVPVFCLPLGTVTEQSHSSTVAEEELKIISIEHYEPRRLVALSKKKPSLIPAEDPTTKVPSMLLSFILLVWQWEMN